MPRALQGSGLHYGPELVVQPALMTYYFIPAPRQDEALNLKVSSVVLGDRQLEQLLLAPAVLALRRLRLYYEQLAAKAARAGAGLRVTPD